MKHEQAYQIAVDVVRAIESHCDRCEIAGSLRRNCEEVGDIEIVCSPKVLVLKDLFGWDEGVVREPMFEKTINGLGKVVKGNADGKMMQIELPEGIMIDLFIPDYSDYYRQYAIRTGSAEFCKTVLAPSWVKKGWVGTKEGLRRRIDCLQIGKSWQVVNKYGAKPPVWESEEHCFQWLGIKYLSPEKRN